MVFISEKYRFIFVHIPKTGGQTIKKTLKQKIENNFNHKDCKSLEYAFLFKNCIKKKDNINYFRSPRHLTMYDMNNKVDKYFTFTFVRNPYDRYYSIYNHFKKRIYKFLCILMPINAVLIILLIYSIIKKQYLAVILSLVLILLFNIYIGIYLEYFKWSYRLIKNDFNRFTIENINKLENSIFGDLYKEQYLYIDENKINFIGRQENFSNDMNKIMKKFNIKSNIKNDNIRNPNNYKGFYKYINKYNKESIDLINKKYDIDFKKFQYKKLIN